MAHLPARVQREPEVERLIAGGLTLRSQGKVRDIFEIPGRPKVLLMRASRRVSIFDFVLPAFVARKGEVLTALTVMWLTEVLKNYRHHLLAYGQGIDGFLPEGLRNDEELRKTCLIVRRMEEIAAAECIVRFCLTGSAYKDYVASGETLAYGYSLPAGLPNGALLENPLFTPTTKSDKGHDKPIPIAGFLARFPRGLELKERSIVVSQAIREHSRQRGWIFVDTKLEFGLIGEELWLADEVATPDSSRFWKAAEYDQCMPRGLLPSPYDKQRVRNWGEGVRTPFEDEEGQPITGINNLFDTEDPNYLAFIAQLEVPQDVLDETTTLYLELFDGLKGFNLDRFQIECMQVAA